MAERRYGFRFSFAEGCVLVASILGASFLVFLFGVYAGRELEARKAAEHTSVVRLTPAEGQLQSPLLDGGRIPATKDPSEKSPAAPLHPPGHEVRDPVIVVAPVKSNDPVSSASIQEAAIPSALQEKPKEPSSHPEAPKEATRKPLTELLGQKQVTPAFPVRTLPTEKKPAEKETITPSLAKKPAPSSGRWSVQVHATRDEEAAQQLAKQLRGQGYAPTVSKIVREGEVWYRVRVGSFANAEEARTSIERFRHGRKFSQAYPVSN